MCNHYICLIHQKVEKEYHSSRILKKSIMTMFNCMKHSILLTRKWSYSLSSLSPFNFQTMIWNVGRCGFILWVTTPKSVVSVVSSRFTILYIILWLVAYTEILNKYSCTTARFTVVLMFLNTSFRDPTRKYIQCCLTEPNYWCL